MGAEFYFSNLRVSPSAVYPGETITVTVDMKNIGAAAGSTDVHLTGWWILTRLAWPDWNGGWPPVPWVNPGQTVPIVFQFAPSLTHGAREDCPIIVEGLEGSVDVILGTATGFTFSDLTISPAAVYPGELITVTVRATNIGATAGATDVHLTGWWVLTRNTGTVAAGASVIITFEFRPSIGSSPGIREIIVEELSGEIEVLGAQVDVGTITVSTNVPGDVYVDNVFEGNTAGGAVVATRLPGGHTVSFGPVSGYTTPPQQTVNVAAAGNVNVSGIYVAGTGTGTLIISTQPVGAQIFLNNIFAGNTQLGIALSLELNEGDYIVSFGNVEGYTAPAAQRPVVIPDTEVFVTGVYHAGAGPTRKPWFIPASIGLGLVALIVASRVKK